MMRPALFLAPLLAPLLIVLGFAGGSAAALAQSTAPTAPTAPAPASRGEGQTLSDGQLEIVGREALEWLPEQKLYVARGGAIARQDGNEVKAATLKARYAEGGKVTSVEAEGGVELTAKDGQARAERGVYDVATQTVTLTGGAPALRTAQASVTARDQLIYKMAERQLIAEGAARAEQAGESIAAERLTAWLAADAAPPGTPTPARAARPAATGPVPGASQLDRVEGEGNLRIEGRNAVITGERGVYRVTDRIATVEGGVTIVRGGDRVHGSRGEVNFATGVTRIYGGTGLVNGRIQPKRGDAGR